MPRTLIYEHDGNPNGQRDDDWTMTPYYPPSISWPENLHGRRDNLRTVSFLMNAEVPAGGGPWNGEEGGVTRLEVCLAIV